MKTWFLARRILAALACLTGTCCGSQSSAAVASPFYGIGKAIDGDSLLVGNREVRLFGIDAPEFSQTCKRAGQDWPCGSQSADQLSKLVTGKDVRCISTGTDQ